MADYRAPANDGEVLAVPDFAAVPGLVQENRRKLDRDDVTIGGLPLRELRALARREVLESALAHDHQPELSHPGVWVKNFALAGLAKKHGGVGLHLIADTDTLKSTSLRFPVFRDRDPASVRLESLAFDRFEGEVAYEDRKVEDPVTFGSFARRFGERAPNWPEPLLWRAWPRMADAPTIGARFTALRREYERRWGCENLERPVSRLSQTEAFARFATHILGELPRFREVYNTAVRAYRDANHIRSDNHPAPELREGEGPFWVRTVTGRRERATATSDVRNLRPRALTLTLFARVCLGDFFIHGIGGGKYDEVTDAIIRDYFGVEPPAYQVLSATLHLPLPGFPSTPDDLKHAERRVRDLHWNPQRHLSPETLARPEVRALVERKAALARAEPTRTDHAARRDWFRALQKVTEELRPFVFKQEPVAKENLARVRAEVAANAVLRRRDYAWVLYPEEMLRPFLQRFLDV